MKISVHTPFRLSLEGKEDIQFSLGSHDVAPDVAQHWFVQAHAVTLDNEPTVLGNDDLQTTIMEHLKTINDLRELLDSQSVKLADRNNEIADLQKRLNEQADEIDSRNANIVDLQNQIDELNKGKINAKESKSANGGKV